MNDPKFREVIEAARARQDALMNAKGSDYTRSDDDRLAYFKRHAGNLGLTPVQVWAVLAGKHWDSILSYVKDGRLETDTIEGRLDDLINYLCILECLIKEREGDRD